MGLGRQTIMIMKREKISILPSLYDWGGAMNDSMRWYVQYSVKDPRTGKMVRKKVYAGLNTIKNKNARYKEADAIIEKYTELLKTGWNPFENDSKNIYTDLLQYKFAAKVYADKKSGNTTINYFINSYMKDRMSGLDDNTISTYTSKYRVFQQWVLREDLADKDITAFTNDVICNFFNYLIVERKSSYITYKKYKQLLHGCFEFVVDQGKLLFNPVQRLPKCTTVNSKEPKPISDVDSVRFMKVIKQNEQMYLYILFEYYCLMRPNEIRMMRVGWIDFERGYVIIPASVAKSRVAKTPIIPEVFMELIRNDFRLHLENKDFYVIGKTGKPGLEHIGKNTMRTRFNVIRKNLNMPKGYMLYSWKHTANVRLSDMDMPGIDRMRQNGHTSLLTTEKYTRNKAGFKSATMRKEYPVL
jgi:integrase